MKQQLKTLKSWILGNNNKELLAQFFMNHAEKNTVKKELSTVK